MKKFLSMLLVLVMALTSVFVMTGCGGDDSADGDAVAGDVIEMKISHIASETDPIHMGWAYLKEQLEERSEGRIQVTIYSNKALSNSNNEDAEKVQQNIVQMTSVPTSSLAAIGNIQEYQVFDYPYLFASNEEFYKVLDSDLAKAWSDRLTDAAGVKALGGYSLGWLSVGSTKALGTLDDYKGQKIRTLSSDLQMQTINAMKASATQINYGECYTALQQGTVDGLLTSTGLFVSDKFMEVIEELAVTKPTALLHVPIVNAEWYDALPDDLKAIYDECIVDYLAAVRQYEADFDADALQTIADSGVKVIEYTDAQLADFKAATESVYADYANIAGQETIDAVRDILGK